jgi:gamma-glutamylcyclotransferase (GGCT)/AIG2-like uncharacterized protein YtfP
MTTLYFAYGANLNCDSMRARCPAAEPVNSFFLRDWRLAFSGVATVLPAAGETVPGALWRITDACETSLDHFEAYPDLYRKHYVQQDGHDIMFYVMNTDHLAPPGLGYLETIADGYADWKLPVDPLVAAVEESHSRDAIITA